MNKLNTARKNEPLMLHSLALVYLSRGIDNGLNNAEKFFNSYCSQPAGYPHELIVIAKGWDNIPGYTQLEQLVKNNEARLVNLPDDGYDWGAYMRITPMLNHMWICFINTHSYPIADNWLFNLIKPVLHYPSLCAVGATASFESFVPILPLPSLNSKRNTKFWYCLRFARNLFNLLLSIKHYQLFPNPHLRSNAFLVHRELLMNFIIKKKIPRRKSQAHKLESGRAGISNYLRKHGCELIVAGADGCYYPSDRWIESRVFRVPKQNNLLVSDNQTREYENSEVTKKRILEKMAWGKYLS